MMPNRNSSTAAAQQPPQRPQAQRQFPSQLVQSRYVRLHELIERLVALPASVNVPMRILALQRSPTSSMEQFAQVIALDPALSAKVLGLANSAFFCPARPIHTVSEAVRTIGLKNLLPLLFGLSLAGLFHHTDLPQSDRTLLWRTSLFKAIVAGEWARSCAPQRADEAFVCGLLQDIALPVIAGSDRATSLELSAVLDVEKDRAQREQKLFGTDHCEVGAAVGKRMGLPQLVIDAITAHHTSISDGAEGWPDELRPIAPALALAAACPHRMVRPDVPVIARRLEACYFAARQFPIVGAAGAAMPGLTELLVSVGERFAQIMRMLGDNKEAGTPFKQFLQDVCQHVAHTLSGALEESARTIGDLRDEKNELEARLTELSARIKQGDYDPLTGVLNRGAFMVSAQKVLAMARSYETECAIGFADLDDFKQLNDRMGHDAGDEALRTLGRALDAGLKTLGIVGRMGGDEFAFLIVRRHDTSRDVLAAAVDKALAGVSGKATCSAGLFWIGIPTQQDAIADLLRCADQLMYQAKRQGKAKVIASEFRPAA
jgi:diguanylate cyclase (GGDEF)-like protein